MCIKTQCKSIKYITPLVKTDSCKNVECTGKNSGPKWNECEQCTRQTTMKCIYWCSLDSCNMQEKSSKYTGRHLNILNNHSFRLRAMEKPMCIRWNTHSDRPICSSILVSDGSHTWQLMTWPTTGNMLFVNSKCAILIKNPFSIYILIALQLKTNWEWTKENRLLQNVSLQAFKCGSIKNDPRELSIKVHGVAVPLKTASSSTTRCLNKMKFKMYFWTSMNLSVQQVDIQPYAKYGCTPARHNQVIHFCWTKVMRGMALKCQRLWLLCAQMATMGPTLHSITSAI